MINSKLWNLCVYRGERKRNRIISNKKQNTYLHADRDFQGFLLFVENEV